MMRPINRSAVVIAPKQSFFVMLKKISGDPEEEAMDPLAEDMSAIYLLPDAGFDDADLKTRMARYYKEIFYAEIEGWFTDTTRWPKKVTWQEFQSWFYISFQSMVFDMLEEDIIHEDDL